MTKGLIGAIVLNLLFCLLAIAANATTQTATAESTLKVPEVLKNKKFEDDKEITDSKLIADSGSLSRYSLKFSLSYFGPPVGDISNRNQPNPDGVVSSSATAIGGSVSGRYRLDKRSAISAGTGLTLIAPFHGADRTDIRTPFISYDRSARVGDVQLRNSFGASLTTAPEFREVGQTSSLSYNNSAIYNFGTSGWAAGVDSEIDVYFFERGWDTSDGRISSWKMGFFPQLKYNFSDKLNVSTSVGYSYWNPRSSSSQDILLHRSLTGRLGMGLAFTRDIYFAPYLSYYPSDLKSENTTVSFATVFSIL